MCDDAASECCMLRYLIDHEVRVDREDELHRTAAMEAIGRCADCLEKLLDNNILVSEQRVSESCTPEYRLARRCQQNFTLVHLAVQENDLDAMKILKQHNVDSGIGLGYVKLTGFS